jgi:hypothetical protein
MTHSGGERINGICCRFNPIDRDDFSVVVNGIIGNLDI